jgi:putative inorganic carbon (HCO3(-)) transporter
MNIKKQKLRFLLFLFKNDYKNAISSLMPYPTNQLNMKISASLITDRVIAISLFFLFAAVPLIINPFAFDYWYKPKIDSIYTLVIIIGITWGIRILIIRKPLSRRENPLFFPLIAYGVFSLLSTWNSIQFDISIHGDTFREEGVYTILSYIALTFVFAHAIESMQQISTLLKGLLFAASLISLYAILQYSGFNPTQHFIPLFTGVENRAGSTIGNPNFLGKFLVLIMPICIVYYFTAIKRSVKYLLLTGCIILFSALIVTFTRASWFSFACSFILLAILLRKRLVWSKQKELFFIAGIFIVVAVLWEAQSLGKKTATGGTSIPTATDKIVRILDPNKGDVAARLYLWNMAIALIKARPFLGYGPDTHALAMEKFNLEYARTFKYVGIIDRAHNNYLDMAIGQGLLGLAAYLSIITTFLIWLIKTMMVEQDSTQKVIYCGIIAAFSGYLLNDCFIFSVVSVSPTFWSLMGLTIAMKRIGISMA